MTDMARTQISPGRILGLTVTIVVALAGLAAYTGHVPWSLLPPYRDDPDAAWETVLEWDFADGPHPSGWGYGEWRLVDGCLELAGGRGDWAVYFTPVVHERDFVLETSVRLISGRDGGEVRAHLLTRDSNRMTHEAGMVLAAAPGRVAVRNMVNGRDYVSDLVPSPVSGADSGWHDLKVAVMGGLISAWIDGDLIYESDRRAPPGYYTEPHLAAENGVARFRNIRIRSSSGT